MPTKYPVHEELKALATERRIVQSFLDWMDEDDLVICVNDGGEVKDQYNDTHAETIGRFLGIDPDELEAERQAMFAEMQANNSEKDLPEDDPSRILPVVRL